MKQVSRNLFFITLGDVGSRLLGFLATTYLARTLLPAQFGLLSIGIAVLGYLFLVTSPGIHIYGARSIARQEEQESGFVADLIGLRLFLAWSCIIIAVLASVFFFEFSTFSVLVILYALSLIPMALSLDWYFQGKEHMQPIGWSRTAINLVYLLLLFILVNRAEDILYAPVSFLVGNLVGTFLLYQALKKYQGSVRFAWQPHSLFRRSGKWFQVLKRSLPLGVGTNLSQVSHNFPALALGIVSSTAAVAYFSSALRIVFVFMILDRLVITLLLPAVARYYKQAADRLQPFLSFVLKTIVVIVLPICIGGTLLADRIIEIIYGSEFAGAIPIFRVLIWYFFFSTLGSVYVFGLIGIGQESNYARMMMWGTALQVPLIALGSVLLNGIGAAIAYVAGEAVIMMLMVSRFQKFVHVPFWPVLVRPALSCTIMGVFLYVVRSYDVFLSIVVAVIVFGTTLVAFRGYTKEDFAMLRSQLL